MNPDPAHLLRSEGETCCYLRLRGVGHQGGTEGGSVEGGGAEGGHPQRQVSGGDADGRTLELQLLDQLVHSLQSPEEDRSSIIKQNAPVELVEEIREERTSLRWALAPSLSCSARWK